MYIPPTNTIHVQNIASSDPLQDLKTNLVNFQNDLDNARGYYYGDYTPASQQTAESWFQKAATLWPQIKAALPLTGQGGEWQDIQNQWGPDVVNQIHDNLYNASPSLDDSMSQMSSAIDRTYPPDPSDSDVQAPAKWIEALVSNVQCLINTGQIPGY